MPGGFSTARRYRWRIASPGVALGGVGRFDNEFRCVVSKARNRLVLPGKRSRRVKGPTLAESKAAIAIAAAFLLLGLGFTFYMAFRFQYPSDVLATPPLGTPTPQQKPQDRGSGEGKRKPEAPQMKLTSTGFTDGGTIPTKYTCAAGAATVSPPLHWSDAPKDTSSFALIVRDLDSRPPDDDILYWMIWNIPVSVTQLPEALQVATAELRDDSRQGSQNPSSNVNVAYRGPCAPAGASHHYVYELFALDQKLAKATGATRGDLLGAIDGHIAGHVVLIGLVHQ